jgi:acyl carrier protein
MIFEYAFVKVRLKEFIVKEFMEKGAVLEDNQSLFGSGVVSSLGVIELLVFIQKNFHVAIDVAEISVHNFDTIEMMMRLIEEKWPKG